MPDGSEKPPAQPGAQSGSQIIERKLATILSADVAEFSRLMNEDEEQTLRTFRGHKKVFEALVLTHHGRVFNTAGDAILAEFASAVEAVRCATDVQSALRTRNDQLAPNRQVRFRIGINLGDVMIQNQDLLGDGVNVAARLQTAAEPGGICISGSVHDQIRNKLSLAFHSMGERSYKNIPQPVRTFSIVEAEGGAPLPSPKPPAAWKNPVVLALAAIVVVAVIGFAAYLGHQRGKTEIPAPVAAIPAPPVPAPVTAPTATTATGTATAPVSQPSAAPSSAKAKETPKAKPKPTKTAAVEESKPAVRSEMASPASDTNVARFDGLYSGPVCYGQTAKMPSRCYEAQATIRGTKITGTWPMPHEPGVTMTLDGDVSSTGDVLITMHSDNSDGTRVTTINLSGTVHDGSLDAEGKFMRGRSANLTWHLHPR